MYIKSYECTRFAGLKDTCVEFDKGLNVILGPNESGKSTIVEGIHSTLFKNIRLRKNNNADKDFSFKFMPKPNGTFIDSKVILTREDGEFVIEKEWGSTENIQLTRPDGNIIKDEKAVNEELKNILSFGESTYSNIVFAKQRELKEALRNIVGNQELTKEINHILRMTLMELDGISIDSIQRNIEEELDSLYKRWNIEQNYPENNRGINNPYKTGLGKIVESYYHKENLRRKMEEVERSEKEFDRISQELRQVKEMKEALNKEKSKLESVEEDVNTRAILNAEIGAISIEVNKLMEINKEWPRTQQILEQLNEKLETCKAEKEKLTKEKENLEKLVRREKLDKKLKAIEELEAKIKESLDEISKIPAIKSEDIDSLSKVQNELMKCETTMKAGKMIAILDKRTDKPVYVTRDFGEKEELEGNLEFEANGLMKISYGEEFEIEVKTGEIDFESLIEKHKSLKADNDNLLASLKIDSIEMGKFNLERLRQKKDEKASLEREVEIVLDGKKKEEIQEQLEELNDLKIFRDPEEIEIELRKRQEEEIEISANIKSKMADLEIWEKKYKNHDNLFDIVIDERAKLKNKQEQLDKLKALPEEFETIAQFKDRLNFLKREVNLLAGKEDQLNADYYQAKNNLSEDTYEELKKEFLQAEKIFNRNIQRGEKLLEIQRIFLETKERLASNPMEALASEFARLLEIITKGIYKRGDIDEEFNIRLENQNGQIPIELLSAGTYDSVSLALRFSLLKHIFKDKGYVILDDCLVDLDPVRKTQSIDLIKELSDDYQIIFTTCDPETAEMLGGNLIEL